MLIPWEALYFNTSHRYHRFQDPPGIVALDQHGVAGLGDETCPVATKPSWQVH